MVGVQDIRSIRIFAQTTPCAHACRYCLVGPKKLTRIAFPRFAHIVERFIEWRAGSDNPALRILAGVEDSFEFDVATLKGLFELNEKIGWSPANRGVRLGGLKWRTEAEMRNWLIARRDEAGLKIVHASLAGHGSVHDGWNGRQGDFDYLVRTMTTAADLGLRVHQRIFVVESTVPTLNLLLDTLDAIPGGALRYLSTFVYHGLATRLEHERITETTRDRLAPRIAAIAKRDGDRWLSEREWISDFRHEIEAEDARGLELELRITEETIGELEHTPCDEIVARLVEEATIANAAIPGRSELHARFGNPTNRKVYASLRELEKMWLWRRAQRPATDQVDVARHGQ